jgi:tRNA(Ile)-lysidine synthase
MEFLQLVESDIRSHGLISHGSSVLVAVSGGADSVCLLHVLCELQKTWGLKLAVAHFDHGLRGEESQRDAEFVAGLAQSYGLPFYLGKGDVKAFSRDNAMGIGLSIQEAARHLRYDFLLKTKLQNGFDALATAHNAQDQAEELLFRLLRGSSITGLCGIPWRREDGVIRPLLARTRQEILAYLQANSIQYVEDSSNLTLKYERNRIRHQLLPLLLQEYNPNLIQTLCRTAEMLREEEAVLKDLAERAFELCVHLDTQKAELNIASLKERPASIRRRVYRMALSCLSNGGMLSCLTARHLYALDAMVMAKTPNASIDLPLKVVARREYGTLYLLMGSKALIDEKEALSLKDGKAEGHCQVFGPGTWRLPGSSVGINISFHNPSSAARLWMLLDYSPYDYMEAEVLPFRRVLWLNGDQLSFPMRLRTRRPGDRFIPFGHTHSMKLKDFFINKKIPRQWRQRLPLLVSHADEIIAVAGVEIAEPFRVTQTTQNILRLSLELD